MTKIEKLKEVIKAQCVDGNWDYDYYMHGLANGLILALSIIEGKSPNYLEAPIVYRRLLDTNGRIKETAKMEAKRILKGLRSK